MKVLHISLAAAVLLLLGGALPFAVHPGRSATQAATPTGTPSAVATASPLPTGIVYGRRPTVSPVASFTPVVIHRTYPPHPPVTPTPGAFHPLPPTPTGVVYATPTPIPAASRAALRTGADDSGVSRLAALHVDTSVSRTTDQTSCLTGMSVTNGNAPLYNDGTIPVQPSDTCSSSTVLNFWIAAPGFGWQEVDSLPVQNITANNNTFNFNLTNDDNVSPLQWAAGTYYFDICSDVCVATGAVSVGQNPVTSPGGCSATSGLGTSCQWYAKNQNVPGSNNANTDTYDQWLAAPYGPSGPSFDQTTDQFIAGMELSSNNCPGNGAQYQWIGAHLVNPVPNHSDFIQVGVEYLTCSTYHVFFYTGDNSVYACTSANWNVIVVYGGQQCEVDVSQDVGQGLELDLRASGTTLYADLNGLPFVQYTIPAFSGDQAMKELGAVAELLAYSPDNTFQAPYNGHEPFASSYYSPLKADFYDQYLDFEYGGNIYQMNGLSTPNNGTIFAPYGNASNGNTQGKIDCGAVNELVGTELGQGNYTAWDFGANYPIGGHC